MRIINRKLKRKTRWVKKKTNFNKKYLNKVSALLCILKNYFWEDIIYLSFNLKLLIILAITISLIITKSLLNYTVYFNNIR